MTVVDSLPTRPPRGGDRRGGAFHACRPYGGHSPTPGCLTGIVLCYGGALPPRHRSLNAKPHHNLLCLWQYPNGMQVQYVTRRVADPGTRMALVLPGAAARLRAEP